MTLTMYQATVPTCVRALNSLAALLEKAAAHAEARKIDPATLLNTRLFPDMFPLIKQVHIANDAARGGAARLANAAVPSRPIENIPWPKTLGWPACLALTSSWCMGL